MTGLPELGAVVALAMTAHTAVNVRHWRLPTPATGRVTVIVPVRDEAHQLADCLASLPADVEVVVVDDGSRDGSAALVPVGMRLVDGTPPPPGWRGKTWACAQGAAVATGDVLVFVDADVRLTGPLPGLPADLALVSAYPALVCGSLLERLVQPLLPWSFLTFLPLRLAERSPRPSLAAAGGQLLAVDAAAYRAVGGHGAVRGAVVEDLALLRAFKRGGFRGAVVDGRQIASCRMYASPRALAGGHTKTLAGTWGPAAAAAVGAGLGLAYLAPWFGRSRLARLGAGAGVAGRLLTPGRRADALAHPLSVLAFEGLLAVSQWRRARGTVVWKGRRV